MGNRQYGPPKTLGTFTRPVAATFHRRDNNGMSGKQDCNWSTLQTSKLVFCWYNVVQNPSYLGGRRKSPDAMAQQ